MPYLLLVLSNWRTINHQHALVVQTLVAAGSNFLNMDQNLWISGKTLACLSTPKGAGVTQQLRMVAGCDH